MSQPSPHFVRAVHLSLSEGLTETSTLNQAKLAFLSQEYLNLERAVRFGLDLPATTPQAIQLTWQLATVAERRGQRQSWLALAGHALAVCPEGESFLYVKLLNSRGMILRRSGDLEGAVAAHRLAEQVVSQSKDSQLWAETQYNLGAAYRWQHRLDEAETAGNQALACFTQPDKWRAAALALLGNVALAKGEPQRAEAFLQAATVLYRELDDATELARALISLGRVFLAQDKIAISTTVHQEALQLLSDSGDALEWSQVQNNLGIIYFRQKQFQQAEMAFRQADSLAVRQSGDVPLSARLAQNLGLALLEQGHYETALPHLQRAQHLWELLGDEIELANTTATLADLWGRQGDVTRARHQYDVALSLLTKYPSHSWAQKLSNDLMRERESLFRESAPTVDRPSPVGAHS